MGNIKRQKVTERRRAFQSLHSVDVKVHVFWEGHKILRNLHRRFEWHYIAQTYLQLPLRQWGAGNVYLLVLSSWKVNIAENPIAVMGL